MNQHIRKFIKKILGIDTAKSLHKNSFDFSGFSEYHIQQFGNKNPDVVFYVIARSPGSGFFSNVSYVINHLKIADNLGFIPVVDMQNFPNFYNELKPELLPLPVKGKKNSWEYYFYSVSDYKLEDVYQSKRVVLTNGKWPSKMTMSITFDSDLLGIFSEYAKVNEVIQKSVDDFTEKHFVNNKVLGIQFRGQEMRTAAGHSFPPSVKQMLRKAREMIETYKLDKIFIVTEEQAYLDAFKREFGKMICYTESYRTYNENAYKIYPRENHRYLLGRDVLVDSLLLSKADGLLCGDSNVSEFARFIGGEKPVFYQFCNGVNSANPLIAKYLWFVKKHLPQSLGGFSDI
jgi:hypothetical protein